MRKFVLGMVLFGLLGVSHGAMAAGAGSGYLGTWMVRTYVDSAGVTRSLIRLVIDTTKTTYIDKFGNTLSTSVNLDVLNECTVHTEAYIDLDAPAYANVKNEWYSLILLAETMKRPITFNTLGCVAISASSTAPKVSQVLIR